MPANLQPRSAGSMPVDVQTEFRQEEVANASRVRCERTCGVTGWEPPTA
jgi:hypothetical protein